MIIIVGCNKGGSGKTTTATNLTGFIRFTPLNYKFRELYTLQTQAQIIPL